LRFANKASDILSLAMRNLKRHPGRSALTALGIIFGVFSVIAMLSIHAGASYQAQLLLRELGSDNIIINARKIAGGTAKASEERAYVLFYGLKFDDVKRLETVPGLKRLVEAHTSQMTAYANGKELAVEVIATEPAYKDVARIEMLAGRFFAQADQNRKRCVITYPLARRLFGPYDPTREGGNKLWLYGDTLTVIGVLKKLPLAMRSGVRNPEHVLLMPLAAHRSCYSLYTTVMMPGTFKREMAEVNQVIMQMEDEKAVEHAAPLVRRLLGLYHGEQDYAVEVPQELIEQQKAQAWLWKVTYAIIAAVSLLVGGIGIMNIMLASVTERTREIGIRRALGAKRRDIIAQFLTEAVALTIVGGALGVGLGFLAPRLVEQALPPGPGGHPFKAIISFATMMVPFIMAVVVGLVSGLYPARRAAMLDPIEALRHE
jgi:putative ABC transport system permease protein